MATGRVSGGYSDCCASAAMVSWRRTRRHPGPGRQPAALPQTTQASGSAAKQKLGFRRSTRSSSCPRTLRSSKRRSASSTPRWPTGALCRDPKKFAAASGADQTQGALGKAEDECGSRRCARNRGLGRVSSPRTADERRRSGHGPGAEARWARCAASALFQARASPASRDAHREVLRTERLRFDGL